MAAALVCGLTLAAGTANAQQSMEDRHVFIEANGGGGLQLGNTDYVNQNSATNYSFPWVGGYNVGATAGVMLGGPIALIASYEYDHSWSRTGSVPGVLDRTQGQISYHTAVVGFRLYVPTGFGAVRADLAAGVIFPFQTSLQYNYGAGLAQLPQAITGQGLLTNNYSVGVAGMARIGYQIPIAGPIYAAMDVEMQVAQSENSGETTKTTNFVSNFGATPPTATSATIRHGDNAARPSTFGFGAGRLVLSLGAAF